MASAEELLRMLSGLLHADRLAAFDELPALIARYAAVAGPADVRVYLADLRLTVLRELTGRGLDAGKGGEELSVEGTLAGRAFRDARILSVPGSAPGRRLHWVPVLDGTQRIGVLRAGTAEDEDATEALELLSTAVALLIVTKRPYSDSYARLVRTETMNTAAEMQWTLMPPRTFANRRITVSAAMEPAYAVGGDAYDYALAGDVLHLAVFDAMGHNSAAGLAANLAMAACRNQRRQDMGLADTSERIEEILLEHFGRERYVTGILADLDLATGELQWVNRGHPPPVVIRGGRWTTTLTGPPAHPMGTDLGLPVLARREQLEPGDRLLLYTDGVTEARDRRGREFGLSRFTDFITRHQADGQNVPETLRRLMAALIEHYGGGLRDDATVLFCEWRGHGGDAPEVGA